MTSSSARLDFRFQLRALLPKRLDFRLQFLYPRPVLVYRIDVWGFLDGLPALRAFPGIEEPFRFRDPLFRGLQFRPNFRLLLTTVREVGTKRFEMLLRLAELDRRVRKSLPIRLDFLVQFGQLFAAGFELAVVSSTSASSRSARWRFSFARDSSSFARSSRFDA